MKLLDGKNVLITGGSKGIGKSIVETFVNAGANVAFTYMSNSEKAIALVNDLSISGRKVVCYKSDASLFSDSEKLMNEMVKEFGSIDVLINNAGITRDNLLMRMTEEQWDSVIDTNLKSCFNTVKSSIKYFLKQKYGSIINISSVVGIKGNAGQSNYAASKAGIIGFTKSVALELGSRNIRSNAIAPGFIETEMTEVLDEKTVQQWRDAIPLKRGGNAVDVSNACLFLASDLSSYITGQVLVVDGGMLT